MITTTRDPLIDSYINQLRAKARSLPRSSREELLEQIEEHLREALPPDHSEADARNVLEELGDPDTIVSEERDRLGIQGAKPGRLDWAVVLLIPFGSWLLIGWIVGVFLLWTSRVWTTREKVLGTLLPPGGLSAIIFFGALFISSSGSGCTEIGGSGRAPSCPSTSQPTSTSIVQIALFAFFVIAGIVTPIILGRRAYVRGR